MTLASRQQDQSGLGNLAALVTAGRGFQSLAMDGTLSALAGGTAGAGGMMNGGGQMEMAVIFIAAPQWCRSRRPDGVCEHHRSARTDARFWRRSEDDIQERIQEFRDRSQREGGGLQGGGQAVPAVVLVARAAVDP